MAAVDTGTRAATAVILSEEETWAEVEEEEEEGAVEGDIRKKQHTLLSHGKHNYNQFNVILPICYFKSN